ncbi:unnamed protein product [Didymodactylos carnosus]|uniref:Uncharacterized protein n=1 Tax=Didymodactylos carnosus TaxID=1234261 RepID=A0A814X9S8_9BILA|nr:unnamed protein product [Didymodactylos carnosus]CAF1214972.1 unnamed protein product [Didymodactylos carnosus]CAF3621277.1 unnamed protein product [Didymodactylos carnosus]CAF3978838.1 unnamed protein product [Didymodactylos carnosus]
MLLGNNHVEGWHNKLHKSFQCEHPTLEFLEKLKTEESSFQLDLAAVNAGQEAKIQQKRYADHNKRLINLIKYPHSNTEQQIAAIAHSFYL